jgi:hypothetical protein
MEFLKEIKNSVSSIQKKLNCVCRFVFLWLDCAYTTQENDKNNSTWPSSIFIYENIPVSFLPHCPSSNFNYFSLISSLYYTLQLKLFSCRLFLLHNNFFFTSRRRINLSDLISVFFYSYMIFFSRLRSLMRILWF